MTGSEDPHDSTVRDGSRHGQAIRIAKWIAIALVVLFLVTRVIRFFLQ